MQHFRIIVILSGLILALTFACSPGPGPGLSPVPTNLSAVATIAPSFSESTGAVVGHVSMPATWTNVTAWLAPFFPDETGLNGFYVLEPSVHVMISVGPDGYFQFSNIDPGQYVVIVGPNPEEAIAVEENTQPRVINVEAGKQLDLGEVRLLSQ